MKPFSVERTVFDPYSPMDKLTITNEDYIIEIWVDNDRDSFSSLELKEITSLFNGIQYLELEFSKDNIFYLRLDGFNAEIHYPMHRIEMKDEDDNTIFKIIVEHEENSIVQIVHLKVIPR